MKKVDIKETPNLNGSITRPGDAASLFISSEFLSYVFPFSYKNASFCLATWRLDVQLAKIRTTQPNIILRNGLTSISSKTARTSSITCIKPYFFFHDNATILSVEKYFKMLVADAFIETRCKLQNQLALASASLGIMFKGFSNRAKKSGSSMVSSCAKNWRTAFRRFTLACCHKINIKLSILCDSDSFNI